MNNSVVYDLMRTIIFHRRAGGSFESEYLKIVRSKDDGNLHLFLNMRAEPLLIMVNDFVILEGKWQNNIESYLRNIIQYLNMIKEKTVIDPEDDIELPSENFINKLEVFDEKWELYFKMHYKPDSVDSMVKNHRILHLLPVSKQRQDRSTVLFNIDGKQYVVIGDLYTVYATYDFSPSRINDVYYPAFSIKALERGFV